MRIQNAKVYLMYNHLVDCKGFYRTHERVFWTISGDHQTGQLRVNRYLLTSSSSGENGSRLPDAQEYYLNPHIRKKKL